VNRPKIKGRQKVLSLKIRDRERAIGGEKKKWEQDEDGKKVAVR
jgi:hypothetical protein